MRNGPDLYDQQFGQDNLNVPSHQRIIRSVRCEDQRKAEHAEVLKQLLNIKL